MLVLKINSIIRREHPTLEMFDSLAKRIESEKLFPEIPRRFIQEERRIGRFTVSRTKSILSGDTVYEVYECEHNDTSGYDFSNKKTGYVINISHGNITRIYKKNNRTLFDGDIELLTAQERYL
jgi:hypothetical protein